MDLPAVQEAIPAVLDGLKENVAYADSVAKYVGDAYKQDPSSIVTSRQFAHNALMALSQHILHVAQHINVFVDMQASVMESSAQRINVITAKIQVAQAHEGYQRSKVQVGDRGLTKSAKAHRVPKGGEIPTPARFHWNQVFLGAVMKEESENNDPATYSAFNPVTSGVARDSVRSSAAITMPMQRGTIASASLAMPGPAPTLGRSFKGLPKLGTVALPKAPAHLGMPGPPPTVSRATVGAVPPSAPPALGGRKAPPPPPAIPAGPPVPEIKLPVPSDAASMEMQSPAVGYQAPAISPVSGLDSEVERGMMGRSFNRMSAKELMEKSFQSSFGSPPGGAYQPFTYSPQFATTNSEISLPPATAEPPRSPRYSGEVIDVVMSPKDSIEDGGSDYELDEDEKQDEDPILAQIRASAYKRELQSVSEMEVGDLSVDEAKSKLEELKAMRQKRSSAAANVAEDGTPRVSTPSRGRGITGLSRASLKKPLDHRDSGGVSMLGLGAEDNIELVTNAMKNLKTATRSWSRLSNSGASGLVNEAPMCSVCGCESFIPNPFKKGHCNQCFHEHV